MRLLVNDTPDHNILCYVHRIENLDGAFLYPLIMLGTLSFKPEHRSANILLLRGRIAGNAVSSPQMNSAKESHHGPWMKPRNKSSTLFMLLSTYLRD